MHYVGISAWQERIVGLWSRNREDFVSSVVVFHEEYFHLAIFDEPSQEETPTILLGWVVPVLDTSPTSATSAMESLPFVVIEKNQAMPLQAELHRGQRARTQSILLKSYVTNDVHTDIDPLTLLSPLIMSLQVSISIPLLSSYLAIVCLWLNRCFVLRSGHLKKQLYLKFGVRRWVMKWMP